MKKINIAVWIWVAIFAFIGLLIFQNQTFFTGSTGLRLNLVIIDKTWELPVVVVVLIFFFSGIFLTYLFSLPGRFKTNKVIKRLNADVAEYAEENSNLKREIAELKGEPLATQTEISQPSTASTEPETTDRAVADRTMVDTGSITPSAWATKDESSGHDPMEKKPTDSTDESTDRPSDRDR